MRLPPPGVRIILETGAIVSVQLVLAQSSIKTTKASLIVTVNLGIFPERIAVIAENTMTACGDHFSGPRTHSARLEEDQNPLDSMFDLPSLKLKTFWRFPTTPVGSYAH